MLRLGKGFQTDCDVDAANCYCRDGWVVTLLRNKDSMRFNLRKVEADNDSCAAAHCEIYSDVLEGEILTLGRPRTVYHAEVAEILAEDGFVCTFEHRRMDGEIVAWTMQPIELKEIY